jgi:hypothetical protein
MARAARRVQEESRLGQVVLGGDRLQQGVGGPARRRVQGHDGRGVAREEPRREGVDLVDGESHVESLGPPDTGRKIQSGRVMGYHSGMKALKPYPPLIFAACAAAMIALRFVAPGPRSPDPELRTFGLALMGVAGSVAGLAASLFKKRKTPVMPFQLPSALVTTGPYAQPQPDVPDAGGDADRPSVWLRRHAAACHPRLHPRMNRVIIAGGEAPPAHFGEEPYCRRVRRWIWEDGPGKINSRQRG